MQQKQRLLDQRLHFSAAVQVQAHGMPNKALDLHYLPEERKGPSYDDLSQFQLSGRNVVSTGNTEINVISMPIAL